MIENTPTGFRVYCDDCGIEEDFDMNEDDWGLLMQKMKDFGWVKRKVAGGDDWEHFCEDCAS